MTKLLRILLIDLTVVIGKCLLDEMKKMTAEYSKNPHKEKRS